MSGSKYLVEMEHTAVFKKNSRTPAFGGISLALRGRGGFGAPVRAPAAPILETATFGGGERKEKKIIIIIIWGAFGVPSEAAVKKSSCMHNIY